ncbi:MAG: SDR family oxidoreductase [Holophagales bacterium]|nr:SDR family oxidoreductase [Holophagales bacterium]
MDETKAPWVLVTGASGGIGLELARCFARAGHPVVVSARSEEKLAQVAAELVRDGAPRSEAIALDLARSEGPAALVAALTEREIAPGILVNNAGYGLLGPFDRLDLEEQLAMVRLNVGAVVELTGRLLPGLVTAAGTAPTGRAGGVLNVASTAAYQPGPYMAVYYASKAFVLSWSEALAQELGGRARVTCLCPGPVPTGFQERAGFGANVALTSGLLPMLSAATVARAGYRGFLRGRRVVVPGVANKAGAVAVRGIPRGTAAKIVARLQKGREPGS